MPFLVILHFAQVEVVDPLTTLRTALTNVPYLPTMESIVQFRINKIVDKSEKKTNKMSLSPE
jgi:hypothetical protein